MAVDYFNFNTHKDFDTLKEARAFWVGIDWVNDSTVDVGGIQRHQGKYRVLMQDTDADVEDGGRAKLAELLDKFGEEISRQPTRRGASRNTKMLFSWEEHCPPHSADSQVRLMVRTVRGSTVCAARVVAVLDSDNPERDRQDAEAIVAAMNKR